MDGVGGFVVTEVDCVRLDLTSQVDSCSRSGGAP